MQIWHTPKWFFGKCSFSSGQLFWPLKGHPASLSALDRYCRSVLYMLTWDNLHVFFHRIFPRLHRIFLWIHLIFPRIYRIFPNIHRIFPRIHRIFPQFTLLIARRKLFWLRWASLPASPCPSPSSPSRPSGTSPPVEVSIGTQLPGIVIQL